MGEVFTMESFDKTQGHGLAIDEGLFEEYPGKYQQQESKRCDESSFEHRNRKVTYKWILPGHEKINDEKILDPYSLSENKFENLIRLLCDPNSRFCDDFDCNANEEDRLFLLSVEKEFLDRISTRVSTKDILIKTLRNINITLGEHFLLTIWSVFIENTMYLYTLNKEKRYVYSVGMDFVDIVRATGRANFTSTNKPYPFLMVKDSHKAINSTLEEMARIVTLDINSIYPGVELLQKYTQNYIEQSPIISLSNSMPSYSVNNERFRSHSYFGVYDKRNYNGNMISSKVDGYHYDKFNMGDGNIMVTDDLLSPPIRKSMNHMSVGQDRSHLSPINSYDRMMVKSNNYDQRSPVMEPTFFNGPRSADVHRKFIESIDFDNGEHIDSLMHRKDITEICELALDSLYNYHQSQANQIMVINSPDINFSTFELDRDIRIHELKMRQYSERIDIENALGILYHIGYDDLIEFKRKMNQNRMELNQKKMELQMLDQNICMGINGRPDHGQWSLSIDAAMKYYKQELSMYYMLLHAAESNYLAKTQIYYNHFNTNYRSEIPIDDELLYSIEDEKNPGILLEPTKSVDFKKWKLNEKLLERNSKSKETGVRKRGAGSNKTFPSLEVRKESPGDLSPKGMVEGSKSSSRSKIGYTCRNDKSGPIGLNSMDKANLGVTTCSQNGKKLLRRNHPVSARAKLKRWILDHLDNPYPDETTKMILSEITGLTLKQVNNWFINERRRNLPKRA